MLLTRPVRTQLEIELKAVLADDQDALGNMVKDAAKYFEKNGKVDLYEVLDAGVAYENSPRKNNRRAELNEEETAYVHLKYAADQYGMTVEDLIRLLDELGYVEMASTEWHDIAEQSFDSLKESASNVISEISNVQRKKSNSYWWWYWHSADGRTGRKFESKGRRTDCN